jgi:hypothetical protein
VTITDDALVAAAQMADRYISDRFLPDKAIDLIDEAGSRMRIRRMTAPGPARVRQEDRRRPPGQGIRDRLPRLRECCRAPGQGEAAHRE